MISAGRRFQAALIAVLCLPLAALAEVPAQLALADPPASEPAQTLPQPGAPEPSLDADTLREMIEHYVRSRASEEVTSIEIPSLERFVLETESAYDVSISSHPDQEVLGTVPLTLSVSHRGKVLRHGVLTVRVEAERSVVVARRAIRAGETLAPDDLTLDVRPLSGLPSDPLRDPTLALGKQLRRSLREGSPLRAQHLEEAPSVRRGDRVRLVLRHGALRIDAPGRALEDGLVGDWIRVRNRDSKRQIEGRVADDGTIHVDL